MNLLIIWQGRYDFDAGQCHYAGNWKGQALKIKTFFGPWNRMSDRECVLAPKKPKFLGPAPSNCPSNVFAPHQNHKGQALYKKTGSLVILCKWEQNCFRAQTPTAGHKDPQGGVKYTVCPPFTFRPAFPLHPAKSRELRNGTASRKGIIYISVA